jgi:hypothetical protein
VVAAGSWLAQAAEISNWKSAARARPISNPEGKMDFNSLMGYLTSLAMLYAWTLFAAGMFALGEKICRNVFPQRQPAASGAKDPRNG